MRQHGTRAKYVHERCRCIACRRANTAYQTANEKRHAYEAFGDVRPALVPADETREHLATLSRHGVGLRQVQKLTGIGRTALSQIRSGETRRVRFDTFDRITAVCCDERAAGRWGGAA